jgi:hypothetical protein
MKVRNAVNNQPFIRAKNFEQKENRMKQKNILLITTDQQSATMLSCTGNPDHQQELERHRKLLRDYITQTKDIFPIKKVGKQ